MIRNAIVEDPWGSPHHHALGPAARVWREWRHPHARSPWPVNYGCLVETDNAADGDPLDVMILSTTPLRTDTCLAVRVIGLLPRPGDDHQLLAVAVDESKYGDARRLAEVSADCLAAIERRRREWITIAAWGDVGDAEALVLEAGRTPDC
ncbi:MAG TPA: inorganic diphosphatase [Thermomicrobiaceae bacterium]|nr:inorganic diphosphatase [Thermomicrobiaceae bacterium]